MLRQIYEIRSNRSTVEKQIECRNIITKEAIDRTETSFGGESRITQKQFEQMMSDADKVAKRWL